MKLLTLAATVLLIGAIAVLSSVTLQASHDAGGGSAGTLPPAGTDEFDINGQVGIDLSTINLGAEQVSLTGSLTMERSEPVNGTIDIEIVQLELTGTSSLLGPNTPVIVRLNPFTQATGQIDASMGFPAESFFDIYFDIDIGEFGHFTQQPISMASLISAVPPFGDKFSSGAIANPIQDNLDPTRTVGSLTDVNISIKEPQKLFTITILKRNDATKETLPGWEMNLYAGTDCTGDAIDSGTTGADGLLEFTGLQPGTYSVEEKTQPGWTNVSDLCQDVALTATAGSVAGLPPCPLQPNEEFPNEGCDEFTSVATVQVVFTNPPIDELECDLSGPTLIARGAVTSKPPDSVDTEIVALDLTGICQPGDIAVTVRESLARSSTGRIVEQDDITPGVMDFPADSFFDVFFEIDTPLGTLHNQTPIRLECKISQIPPFGCLYEPDVGVIPLFNVDKKEVGTMLHASHLPVDPNKALVIFSNLPDGTPTVTPTATATPPFKVYSVTVLKLNSETQESLSGWEMTLYEGEGCSGEPLASASTDDSGLVDFTGLQAGVYSVEETPQSGWTNVSELCQDIEVGGAMGTTAGLPACPTQPDLDFPQTGCDEFDSGARVNIQFNDSEEVFSVTLNGPTQIERKNAPADLDSDGLDEVVTEIVHLELTGNSGLGPITVRQSPTRPSLGEIEEQENITDGVMDFAADSDFDVFFEVDTALGLLHNEEPLSLQCKIDEIPPVWCFYQPPIANPIELFDENGIKVATILHALHLPLPTNEVLIVFTNEPGPAATPTPPPETDVGDVNCTGGVNSIDATIVLQLDAGLIASVLCEQNGDVNGDGAINSLDAVLILQFDAGLISVLPLPLQ